ncbi:MAG: type I restriction enzyme HsdR N-terminal domain-containing protein [Rhabdochlamydiaceae bacterium]
MATPEEVVRQTWIQRMIGELKFPRELLAVEKELKALPHLMEEKNILPNRRIDLLSFMKKNDTVRPLVLIECKEAELTQEALAQLISYNHYVKAPYIAVVNRSEIRFLYQLSCKQCEISRLPSYLELTGGFDE